MTKTLSVLDQLESGQPLVTRHRVLIGEDGNRERRGDKVVIARSDCTFRCVDYPTLRKCVDALQESDVRLLARPEQLMLWDWRDTWVQFDNPQSPQNGGTVYLGVAWYDRAFFDERKSAGTGIMHQYIYDRIGLALEDDVTVEHFLGADVACWN